MKERAIPFSAPMVRAILDGRKTQTRRIVKCDGKGDRPGFLTIARYRHAVIQSQLVEGIGPVWPKYINVAGKVIRDGDEPLPADQMGCPYGAPGDLLYVKEAWRTRREWDSLRPAELPCRNDFCQHEHIDWIACPEGNTRLTGRYRHARFMPRWASRITLEITNVRVERLNDISEEDAIAEGCSPVALDIYAGIDPRCKGPCEIVRSPGEALPTDFKPVHKSETRISARDKYRQLWDSINGPGSWEKNPFCWVLDFRKV